MLVVFSPPQLSVQVEHQGSGGIRSVGVNAVLADVPIGFTGSLEQKFSVKLVDLCASHSVEPF